MDDPSFDLVVATVVRTKELARFIDSLRRQTYTRFRVLLVDQNEDERVVTLLQGAPFDVVHLRSPRGLSRARNVALAHIAGDVVAFPDDDCVYGSELLTRVASAFARRPELDGLLGRTVDSAGRSSANWATTALHVTRDNVWYSTNSNAVFLRRALVGRVGPFDEVLGLGSGTPWSSGEETEYIVRAVAAGARIEYEPDLTIIHPDQPLTPRLGLRDGASVGYVLGKHRYPRGAVARMLVRPLGGVARALVAGDLVRARAYAATARGRLLGYRAGLSSHRGAA